MFLKNVKKIVFSFLFLSSLPSICFDAYKGEKSSEFIDRVNKLREKVKNTPYSLQEELKKYKTFKEELENLIKNNNILNFPSFRKESS